MTPLLHIATVGIMLLHALLGCCLHHEHRCAAEGLERGAVHAEHHRHDGRCSPHAGSAQEAPAPEHSSPLEHSGPGEPQPCESGECVFVATAVSGVALDLECQWLDAARLADAEQAAIARPLSSGPRVDHWPPLAERVQAEYCSWLI